MCSAFLIKNVSKEIIDDFRFCAYEKANDYVKHMKKSLENKKPPTHVDKSDLLTKTFQTLTPENSKIRQSSMPKSTLSSQIKLKINLVNAYHHLSDLRPKSSKSRVKAERNSKKSTSKRIFSPKKYNHSITKLVNCTHRPSGSPEVFITNESSMGRTTEKFYQRTETFKRYTNLNKFFPLKEVIKKHKKSPKAYNLESTFETNLFFKDIKTAKQFYSFRDKTPKPQLAFSSYSPTHSQGNKGNK